MNVYLLNCPNSSSSSASASTKPRHTSLPRLDIPHTNTKNTFTFQIMVISFPLSTVIKNKPRLRTPEPTFLSIKPSPCPFRCGMLIFFFCLPALVLCRSLAVPRGPHLLPLAWLLAKPCKNRLHQFIYRSQRQTYDFGDRCSNRHKRSQLTHQLLGNLHAFFRKKGAILGLVFLSAPHFHLCLPTLQNYFGGRKKCALTELILGPGYRYESTEISARIIISSPENAFSAPSSRAKFKERLHEVVRKAVGVYSHYEAHLTSGHYVLFSHSNIARIQAFLVDESNTS